MSSISSTPYPPGVCSSSPEIYSTDALRNSPSAKDGWSLLDELQGREAAVICAASTAPSSWSHNPQATLVLAWAASLIQRFYMHASLQEYPAEVSMH